MLRTYWGAPGVAARPPELLKDGRGAPSLQRIVLAFNLYRLQHDVFVGTVLPIAGDFRDFFDDIVALHYLAKNRVFASEPVGVGDGNEKLRSISVRASIGHGQLSSFIKTVGRPLGLIFELVAGTTHACALRVAALDHKIRNDAMENGSVIKRIFGFLASRRMRPLALTLGELDEVGDSLGRFLFEKAANDVAFAGFKYGVGSGCAGHRSPRI